jgi:hypothetical protein
MGINDTGSHMATSPVMSPGRIKQIYNINDYKETKTALQ